MNYPRTVDHITRKYFDRFPVSSLTMPLSFVRFSFFFSLLFPIQVCAYVEKALQPAGVPSLRRKITSVSEAITSNACTTIVFFQQFWKEKTRKRMRNSAKNLIHFRIQRTIANSSSQAQAFGLINHL